jgi:lipopolysaccharide export system protein LptA
MTKPLPRRFARWKVATAIGAAALALTAAIPAVAQVGRSGGGPISVDADSLEIVQSERVAIYRGNVVANQGINRLRGQTITVLFRPGRAQERSLGASFGEAERLTAVGDVYFITPTEQARGDRAVYEVASDTVTVTGAVIVQRGPNVIRGCELVVQLTAGRSTMKACGSDRRSSTGRVRSVFVPGSENAPRQ